MIDLSTMGFGAKLMGVAVKAPAEPARLAPLLASVDEAARYAGIEHRLLISTVERQRDGWVCLALSQSEVASKWKIIAQRHSSHCAWLALWDGERLMPRDWLLGCLMAADNGRGSERLLRMAPAAAPASRFEPGQGCGLIGVTICTPGYGALATEASRRFRQFTGLEVLRIEAGEGSGFEAKLRLPELSPQQPVVYFDADLWLLRETDFAAYFQPMGVAGVVDPGTADAESFVSHDVAALGLDAARYFNSGLFLADFRAGPVRAAFAAAKAAFAAKAAKGIRDYGEQSCLNLGIQSQGKLIPFTPLPAGYNFFMHAVTHGYGGFPPIVNGLHAAGIGLAEKMVMLEQQAAVFGYRTPRRKGAPATAPPPEPALVAAMPDDGTIQNAHVANNDKALPIEARAARALRWVRGRREMRHILGFEGLASCKCFLTYRAVDGLLDFATWQAEVAGLDVDIDPDHPLWVRWEISQRTAEIYLMLARRRTDEAESKASGLLEDVRRHDWLKRWPPIVANVVRAASLRAYLFYLRGREQDAAGLVEQTVATWRETMGALDWQNWPMRFAEMRDDCHALLNCMVIARACGAAKFADHAWCEPARMNRQTKGEHPYVTLMRDLGALADERRLWR